MNVYIKTLNKVPINIIKQHIKRTIHHDQVGFIIRMEVFFSIFRSLSVIHHIKLKYEHHVIISIDAEKACGKINTHL